MQTRFEHGTFFRLNHDDTHPRHTSGFYYEKPSRAPQTDSFPNSTQFPTHNQKFCGAMFRPDSVSPTPSTSTEKSESPTPKERVQHTPNPHCPFSSRKLLFLDVDGVILPQNSPTPLDEQLDMQKRLASINCATGCDIIVSSSWQFDPEYMVDLINFLSSAGFEPSRVHTLISILPGLSKEDYEASPYCQSRARGILQAVDFHARHIDSWVVLDDLPLDSTDFVAIPFAVDLQPHARMITHLILAHANTYFVDAQNVAGWFNRVEAQVQAALRAKTIGKSDRYGKKGGVEWLAGLFSKHACRFGWKASGANIGTQARFICKCVDLTQQLPEELCVRLVEAVGAMITEYVRRCMDMMGEEEIKTNLLRTDMFCGLTDDQAREVIFSLAD